MMLRNSRRLWSAIFMDITIINKLLFYYLSALSAIISSVYHRAFKAVVVTDLKYHVSLRLIVYTFYSLKEHEMKIRDKFICVGLPNTTVWPKVQFRFRLPPVSAKKSTHWHGVLLLDFIFSVGCAPNRLLWPCLGGDPPYSLSNTTREILIYINHLQAHNPNRTSSTIHLLFD